MGNKSSPYAQSPPLSVHRDSVIACISLFLLIISTQLPVTEGRLKEKAELNEILVFTLNLDQMLALILTA